MYKSTFEVLWSIGYYMWMGIYPDCYWLVFLILQVCKVKMSQRRKYNDNFLRHGFSFLIKNGIQEPQCVSCRKTLTNESMKPSRLSEHFTNMNPGHVNKGIEYFKNKAEGLKRGRLDAGGTFQQKSNTFLEASYYISLQLEKEKKWRGADLTLACPNLCVSLWRKIDTR